MDKEPCNNKEMGEHACSDRSQCWEPCGELGHSAEHARPAPQEVQDMVNQALSNPVVAWLFPDIGMTTTHPAEMLKWLDAGRSVQELYAWPREPVMFSDNDSPAYAIFMRGANLRIKELVELLKDKNQEVLELSDNQAELNLRVDRLKEMGEKLKFQNELIQEKIIKLSGILAGRT